MREADLQKKLDNLLKLTESDIGKEYGEALEDVFRRNKGIFREIEGIMDGEPPKSCVTDFQKETWRKKRMNRLLDESRIAERIALALAAAGNRSVAKIRRFGVATYNAAYDGVAEQLEE